MSIETDPVTQLVKDKLAWMAEHPGEWMWWGRSRFAPSSRHLRAPSFERQFVSSPMSEFDGVPFQGWHVGLWVRYVGNG
jgi:hypothetical protein